MTFEVADIGRGDVLGVFETMDAAQAAVREMCEGHPEAAEDIAVLTIGDDGHRVRDPLPAESFLGVHA